MTEKSTDIKYPVDPERFHKSVELFAEITSSEASNSAAYATLPNSGSTIDPQKMHESFMRDIDAFRKKAKAGLRTVLQTGSQSGSQTESCKSD